MKLTKQLILLTLLLLTATVGVAQTSNYKMHKFATTNGSILQSISPDGKWIVVNLGTSASGLSCASELYNVETEEHFPVKYSGREITFYAVSNENAEGYVTVVGTMSSRPVAYRFKPSEPNTQGKLTVFPNKLNWAYGELTSVTPDGKYAVGHFTQYTGQDVQGADLNGEYWFDGLFVDIEKGTTLETPGAPTGDRHGVDQHAMKFTSISPDGKYILGAREWYMPTDGFSFIYDIEKKDYTPLGFTKEGNRLKPMPGIEYIDFPVMSPNGRYIGGLAVSYAEIEGSDYASEVKSPFRYDVTTGEMKIFSDSESSSIDVGCIDDNGTIFGNPDTGSPLRHFRIFYQDKFWIPFSQLCQQRYGFNFSHLTGFEFSGTATSVSADGTKIVAFSDPQSESFCFDFGTTVEEACSNFDLLSSYTVNPVAGSTFSKLTTLEINFGRAIQILGKGNTHAHLYKKGKNGAADTKVRDGVSTDGGLQLKSGSKTTVNITFRTTTLENGEDYYVLLDAGAVAVAADENMANKQIRIDYKGRSDEPVKLQKLAPESGSEIDHFDSSTSYILLSFDCPVQLTDNYEAYIERKEDNVRVATLTMASGSTEETKHQVLVYPTSTTYLYNEVEYRVVISKGSICDYAGTESSYNEDIVAEYKGKHVREASGTNILFYDDFNDPNKSLSLWLNYEGDHRTPLSEMANWGFDANNTPWNFSTHDSEDSSDFFATSHSLYAPSGQSDDWMLTPQLAMPEDGKAILTFDAQRYRANKEDRLKVYVIEEDRVVSYLNDANMKVLREEAELIIDTIPVNIHPSGMVTTDWQHFRYPLAKYAGKNIYIAFVNENNNQSCLFVDNVVVQREILFTIGFSNDDRVVNKESIALKGTFTVKTADFASGNITLVLKDAEAKEVSRIEWKNISGTFIADRPIPMNFPEPLPLTVGKENEFTIDVLFDGKDRNGEEYVKNETLKSSIFDLVFLPTKRVVLEEMTGVTCPNCPQGIIAIEACERQFKDQFIPISIHAYDNDDLGQEFVGYAKFLGLNAAPSGCINRKGGIYYPMYNTGSAFMYDMKEQNLWYNIVADELEHPALSDITLTANLTEDGRYINYNAGLKFAIDTKQQTSLLVVVMEDDIVYLQENNFANSDAEGLGEWGLGGRYGSYYAYPVTHNDVVRSVVGQTFSGTLGMFPSELTAGETYTTEFSSSVPAKTDKVENLKAAAMLIDTNTGEIINAVVSKVLPGGNTGIKEVNSSTVNDDNIYTISGTYAGKKGAALPAGIYIQDGKKIVIK